MINKCDSEMMRCSVKQVNDIITKGGVMTEMKDSGKRQQFEGGAQRDTAEGKPVMHLLSPHVLDCALGVYKPDVIDFGEASETILALQRALTGRGDYRLSALKDLLNSYIDIHGIVRLCNWLEQGAKKYDKFNWAKGMYFTRVIDSLLRHLRSVVRNEQDEDHPAAIMCNLMFLIHYIKEIEAGRLDPKWDDMFDFRLYKPEDKCHNADNKEQ